MKIMLFNEVVYKIKLEILKNAVKKLNKTIYEKSNLQNDKLK